ncbi:MAG: monovalent cation/H+ antiporter complex subunit F [Defluviitaleaceae bacterium]|nr:monovalent cation/H+ antiporter complex subunit F [Defluviitaleaceae bacterium]
MSLFYMSLLEIILWVILLFAIVCVIRVIKGPTIWDRVLGFSIISSKLVLIIAIFSSMRNTAYLLDLAIIYTLFGFLGEIFLITFLSKNVKERG